MNRLTRFRITVLITAIALIMGLFTFRLYKVQTSVDETTIQEADSV